MNRDMSVECDARSRIVYLLATGVIIALGLGIRRFKEFLPVLITAVAPDALWTIMVLSILALLFPRARSIALAAGALGISIAVELSQLYHAPWIDMIRSYRLGGWVLGFTFLWSDLLWYTFGSGIGFCMDRLLCRMRIR